MFNEQEYLQKFGTFFRRGHADFSSSYKPVFLKSIMDLADYDEHNPTKLLGHQWIKVTNDKLHVELDFPAIRFTKYYWDMYYWFRLRQSPPFQSQSDVNIHQFFIDSDGNPLKPPKKEDLVKEKHQELRRNVIRESIKREVLPRLKSNLELYETVKGKNHIIFELGTVEFFRKFKGVLCPAIDYVLTKYLESINFSPRIAEKVRGKPKRGALKAREMEVLREDNACFYCGGVDAGFHFDHVIPFDYLFSTELFNSVRACARCNSQKLTKLPTPVIFDKVLERNRVLERNKKLSDYTREWYCELYRKCVTEYHGKREYFTPKVGSN